MSAHTHHVDWKDAFTVEPLENSQLKITGELPFAELQSERTAALVALGKNVELDGFRKGHVPTPILEKHLGEMTILAEMAERAISHAYPHIVDAHKLDVIGQPNIEVTKLAKDNPLGISIIVSVMPRVTLPDYTKIAKDINKNRPSDDVSDEKLQEQIEEIQKRKKAYERMQELAQQQTTTNAAGAEMHTHADGTVHEGPAHPEPEAVQTKDLPELTDEYVKTLGQPGQFEDVADFKAKLREHLEIETKQNNAAQHRANITDAIIKETKMELPKIMIDSELNQMWAQMEDDIKRADLKMDDYLAHIKKTKEELFLEWTPAAESRAKLQIVLNEIAKAEDMKPDMDEVETQSKELLTRFKDADAGRVKLYVASVLLNEAVMKQLEEIK